MDHDELLKPSEAAEHVRMTKDLLAQLRYRGKGPRYFKPTDRTVLYRRSDLDEWLAASERTSTSDVA